MVVTQSTQLPTQIVNQLMVLSSLPNAIATMQNVITETVTKSITEAVVARDRLEFRRLIGNQCRYCMRILANPSGATNHQTHRCAERDFATTNIVLDPHQLLVLVKSLINPDREDDVDQNSRIDVALFEMKVLVDEPDNIQVQYAARKKSTKGKGKKQTVIFDFRKPGDRMKLLNIITKKYYVNRSLLVDRATREWMALNDQFLRDHYNDRPDPNEEEEYFGDDNLIKSLALQGEEF